MGMRNVRSALFIACFFGFIQSSLALPPLDTPYQILESFDFSAAEEARGWAIDGGSWFADSKTFNVTAPATSSIATIETYFSDPYSEEWPFQPNSDYVYRVRLMNESADAQTRVGLVYNYQDASNYYELVFSPAGIVQARRVLAGAVTVLAEKAYAEGGQGRWLNAEVYGHGGSTTLVVNGNLIVRDLPQETVEGRLGLIAHNTTARFDAVRVDLPTDAPRREWFSDGIAQEFAFDTNHWKIENGVLKNFTVDQTNEVAVSELAGWEAQSNAFRARLRNPYGGPGNLIGVFFGSYEVLFSRTGVVRLDAVDSDVSRQTLATASIPRLSSDWFEVVVSPGFLTIDVWLNGTQVLSYEDDAFERGGAIGVVTHWSPGEVDRVDFNDAFLLSPYVESFAAKPPYEQVISGTWAAAGGTYNSTAGRATDVSLLYGSPTQPIAPGASMDFSYRARVKLPSSSAQSSIGFVTHYNAGAGEYYEVLLTGGGQVIMKKHVQGTVIRQATGTYVAAPNAWINLELRCVGNQSRVLVNGTSRLHGILQGQLRSGRVGVVTHGTPGKFDDVVFAEWK